MVDILVREVAKIIGENKEINLSTGEVYYEWKEYLIIEEIGFIRKDLELKN